MRLFLPSSAAGIIIPIVKRYLLTCGAVLLSFAPVSPCVGDDKAGETAATRPQRQWGRPRAGLQISLSLSGQARYGGRMAFDVALRNTGRTPVALGRAQDAFMWLFVVQRTSGAQAAYFTQKVPVKTVASNWPAKLGQGVVRMDGIDVSGRQAYVYGTDLELEDGYPAGQKTRKLKQVGALNEVLNPHTAAARMYLYVPRGGGEMLLVSNTLKFRIAPPALESLSPKERKKLVGDLLKQFNSGPWEGQEAHAVAVQLGGGIVPDLIGALGRDDQKAFSVMWIATSLTDIGDARAADALVELLEDPRQTVRYVAAYHGVKLKSNKFDAALTKIASGGDDPMLSAWAARGFAEFHNRMPQKLLDIAAAGKDPRARSIAAKVLGHTRTAAARKRLISLLNDDNRNVRAAAANAAATGKFNSTEMIDALIGALDRTDDETRSAVVMALRELSGHNVAYDPRDDASARNRAIKAWKDWWAKNRSTYGGE